jgi:hypothetical protein
VLSERSQRQSLIPWVVLDEQYGLVAHHGSTASPQREIKRRAAIDRAFGPDAAAMTVDDTPRGC